jgi:hypothetical protein
LFFHSWQPRSPSSLFFFSGCQPVVVLAAARFGSNWGWAHLGSTTTFNGGTGLLDRSRDLGLVAAWSCRQEGTVAWGWVFDFVNCRYGFGEGMVL